MDNLFVWIVMFAGAAIALLGIFLITSEKELKVKRREIEELLARLENGPQGTTAAQLATPPSDNSAESAELRKRNQDLQNQINTLSSNLELSRRTIDELEASRRNVDNGYAETQQLREERQRSQSRIAELESEISNGQEKLRELESLGHRLSESERDREALREESRRHNEEIVRWRERLAESEENRRRLASLQVPYNELMSKHAALAEQQRDFQRELAGFAQMIATPSTEPKNTIPSHASEPSAGAHVQPQSSAVFASPLENGTESRSTAESDDAAAVPLEQKTTRRFGIFSTSNRE